MPNKSVVEYLLVRCQQQYLEIEYRMLLRQPGMPSCELVALLQRNSEHRRLMAEEQGLLELREFGGDAAAEDFFDNPFAGREWDRRRKFRSRHARNSGHPKAKHAGANRSSRKLLRQLKVGEGW